jgi:hypothetical protein
MIDLNGVAPITEQEAEALARQRNGPTLEEVTTAIADIHIQHPEQCKVIVDYIAKLHEHAQRQFERGRQDERSRSGNRPGDGDMGG